MPGRWLDEITARREQIIGSPDAEYEAVIVRFLEVKGRMLALDRRAAKPFFKLAEIVSQVFKSLELFHTRGFRSESRSGNNLHARRVPRRSAFADHQRETRHKIGTTSQEVSQCFSSSSIPGAVRPSA